MPPVVAQEDLRRHHVQHVHLLLTSLAANLRREVSSKHAETHGPVEEVRRLLGLQAGGAGGGRAPSRARAVVTQSLQHGGHLPEVLERPYLLACLLEFRVARISRCRAVMQAVWAQELVLASHLQQAFVASAPLMQLHRDAVVQSSHRRLLALVHVEDLVSLHPVYPLRPPLAEPLRLFDVLLIVVRENYRDDDRLARCQLVPELEQVAFRR
eukprot:766287-Hanusia_phi.AAC.1